MSRIGKWVLMFCLLSVIMLYNSCKLLRPVKELKEVQKEKSKEERQLKVDIVDTEFSFDKMLTDKTRTSYNEEILIKKAPQPIELTATFKVDTNAYLNRDTLLKLVDINDSKVSVTIYQNKKTNELTAKVISKNGNVKDVAFDELEIKRSFNQVKDVKDSTHNSGATHKDQSTDKQTKVSTSTVENITKKDYSQAIFIGVLLLVAVIWIAFSNKQQNK